jgi:hypothetical protein
MLPCILSQNFLETILVSYLYKHFLSSWIFLETVAHLMKKFLTFYGTKRFITVFTDTATLHYPEIDEDTL